MGGILTFGFKVFDGIVSASATFGDMAVPSSPYISMGAFGGETDYGENSSDQGTSLQLRRALVR